MKQQKEKWERGSKDNKKNIPEAYFITERSKNLNPPTARKKYMIGTEDYSVAEPRFFLFFFKFVIQYKFYVLNKSKFKTKEKCKIMINEERTVCYYSAGSVDDRNRQVK